MQKISTNEAICISLRKASELSGLGRDTTRRIAEESGALLKVGGRRIVDKEAFFKYLREECKN